MALAGNKHDFFLFLNLPEISSNSVLGKEIKRAKQREIYLIYSHKIRTFVLMLSVEASFDVGIEGRTEGFEVLNRLLTGSIHTLAENTLSKQSFNFRFHLLTI